MKILQIIDNKTTYHKDIENILKTLSDLKITTYSIDNNDIYEYEKINNTFDYIFIYAFPKTNKKYYQLIEQYLTPKKILFIDFISDISLFENISFDLILLGLGLSVFSFEYSVWVISFICIESLGFLKSNFDDFPF